MARLSEHGIRLSAMSPSFLNSNSTSHTWPFSAVAELVDNASDPGVSAKQIWIDVVEEAGHLCLTFIDNGGGMTPNKLHKMLSFGFTEKGSGKASLQAIGVYGNGFKSGSMRLGRDALIFTKNGGCQTVGMLSQTYLENIKAQAVIVPIVPFSQQTKSLVMTEDSEASLAAILQNSIVSSIEQIHGHFDSILSKKGTKILIWNIRRGKDGKPEIDFETDASDFRLPLIQIEELKKGLRSNGSLRAQQNIPEEHYSLKAYLSILYLKPRTQIILRGNKNIAKLVSKSLKHIEHDVYKPHFSKEKVKVTFGMSPKNKEHYGIMMYNKNRLIKAYEKVGCQLKASGQRSGVGVIGIIECNFLKPAHNKQDFEYTKEYRLTLGALGLKLSDYWKEVTEKKARGREFQSLDRDENKDDSDDAPMWVQCEECLKWRSVPAKLYNVTPESWNCSLNPNPRYRSCSAPEEAEDSEELLTPSYQKNHKKQETPKSRKRERSFEVCAFDDPEVKHQILSRSSSEPSQPTFQSPRSPHHVRGAADRSHAGENTLEEELTNTGDLRDDITDAPATNDAHKHRLVGREKVVKDATPEQVCGENVTHDLRLGNKVGDDKKDANMEPVERQENTNISRKSGSELYCVPKKPGRLEEEQPDSKNRAEEMSSEKQRKTPEPKSSDKSQQDSRRLTSGDTPQRTLTKVTWTHSTLTPTEGPRPSAPPPESSDLDVNMQKLAGLEKEVQRLQRLLGLEITKTTVGTMTTGVTEKPKEGPATPAASTESREVGCQTDGAESSTSSSSPAQEVKIEDLRGVCGPKEQQEEKNLRKKTDTPSPIQSRTRASDSEAFEDSRQESLQGIRNNVVVLLTALLPQLDLAGISLETNDVDTILQQIIEVNSLKL